MQETPARYEKSCVEVAADGDGRGNVQMDGAHVRGQAAAAECEQGGAANAARAAVLLHKRMGLLSVSSPAADRARQKDVQDMEYARCDACVQPLGILYDAAGTVQSLEVDNPIAQDEDCYRHGFVEMDKI